MSNDTPDVPPRRTITDFRNDWTLVVRRRLAKLGVPIPSDMKDDFVRYAYWGLLRRRGERRPRTVLRSAEFNYPSEHTVGLALLEQKIESGDDLTPHLSRGVKKLISDGLFDDWAISHFHLGTALEPGAEFIERTGALLYAFLTPTTAYLIAVRPHNHWADLDLLEIMHANWPALMSQWRMPGASQRPEDRPGKEAILSARANGIVAPITLRDGTCYIPPNLGYSTARVPNLSVSDDDRVLAKLALVGNVTEERFEKLHAEADAAGTRLPAEPVRLHFDVDDDDHAWIVCEASGFRWSAMRKA